MEKLKILIPTDFSVQAEFAYLMVKRLEVKTPVDIHFVHVMNVPDTVTMDANGNIQTCGEIDVKYVVKQKEIAERKLADLKNIYGNDINSHFILGKVIDGILNFAESNHFDLIVMGTKGAWGLKEKLSGSETQIIARKSKIPVLSLMCDRSDLNIQNILLVHNFNHPAKEDLQLMHKLIKAFNTKFHLLQITSGKVDAQKTSVEANMKMFAELNNITNYECHLINDNDVEKGVVHFNQMNNMDIICIGTHGKGGIFHHSATERLIKHLFKPIISFHLN
ncbi:MAG: universal stress protein [Chitinophagaceae bacterium]|nr:universal stress protein [Chitinophagaceae bacterium]MDP1763879.1 universal stress protein [Sediminibacterium sp.]MDP1811627.1 universal stress protein [Sediminibacterium sp.]MDP3127385.1 universal stress protein [Sediminibacterium sp.]MDP3665248.1 universal stress protein [Sediminibacterium sp.]